jgi:hypothetical protein
MSVTLSLSSATRASCVALFVCGLAQPALAQTAAPAGRLWASGEYLVWHVKDVDLPALITTGPIDATNAADRPGELGQAGTRILLGDGRQAFTGVRGGQFAAGGWLDTATRLGVEGRYTFLSQGKAGASLTAPGTLGSTPLLIPFFNPVTGKEDSTGIAIPTNASAFSGTGTMALSTEARSAGADLLMRLSGASGARLDALAGYHGLVLTEDFVFTTVSQNIPPATADLFRTSDEFRTRNRFDGGEVGLRFECPDGRVSLRAAGRVAIGSMRQTTTIAGGLDTNDFDNFGAPQHLAGGYLALPTNIGTYERRRMSVVTEATAGIDWHVLAGLHVTASYTWLSASRAARAADEIDRTINPSQGPAIDGDPTMPLTGAARPAFPGRDGTYWAQAVGLGAALRF